MGKYYNEVYFLGVGAGKAKKLGLMIAKSISEKNTSLSLQVCHIKSTVSKSEYVSIIFDTKSEKGVEVVVRITDHAQKYNAYCKHGIPNLTIKIDEFKTKCNDIVISVVDFVIKNAV